MVKLKEISTTFKTIAEYEDMLAELKRVAKIVKNFESGLLKQVGKRGGNVKFPDGIIEVTAFGKGEGRLNPKYKPMWMDLKSMVESSAVWNTSKKDMEKILKDIEDDNTDNADVKQKIMVKKESKTVKAKVEA